MPRKQSRFGQPAVYNSTLPTLSDDDSSALNVDDRGRLLTGASAPGTGADNLGKAEDAAHSSGDVGVMLLGVRNDSNATLSGTDLDYTPIQTTSSGRIRTEVHGVGTASGDLGKAEDAAHTSGDVGVMGLAVRKDTAASLAGTDGDYQPQITDSTGHTWMREGFAPGAEDNTNNVIAVAHKPVVSATYSPSAGTAPLNDVDVSVKASAGVIKSISVSNANAAVRYLQIHNKATAPAGGDTAILSFAIPAGTAAAPSVREIGTDFFGENGLYLSTGIALGVSTVAATFTGATTTDHTLNWTFA